MWKAMQNLLMIQIRIGIGSQMGAADEEYGDRTYNDISEVIDFLLSHTPQMWKDFENT